MGPLPPPHKSMKKRMIAIMSLVLCMSMSLCVSASAASYVPDDITYQNLNGQQLAVKVFTLLPDQDPGDLIEKDFEHDGILYVYSDTVKKEQTFNEESMHKEVVTVTTATKNLEDILAALEPTLEYEDGTAKGTLALNHSTLKTEAAGYTSSNYTVTATKNYTGLARNDSGLIEKTVTRDGRTLSLSNVTWTVESTALVGDELVPATYSAVATYSGSAKATKATGYITTAEYSGKVTSSGVSSIQYTVTYLGTPISEEDSGFVALLPVIIGTLACAGLAVLLIVYLPRKNTTVYAATGKGNEYDKCGRLLLRVKKPELHIDQLKNPPEGVLAIEVDEKAARKLFGKSITIRYFDRTMNHTVGAVNGQYWFKVDVGTAPADTENYEEDN